jgi:hypothetical protein
VNKSELSLYDPDVWLLVVLFGLIRLFPDMSEFVDSPFIPSIVFLLTTNRVFNAILSLLPVPYIDLESRMDRILSNLSILFEFSSVFHELDYFHFVF